MRNNQSRTFKYFSVIGYGPEKDTLALHKDCLFAGPVHIVEGREHRHFIFGFSSSYTVDVVSKLLALSVPTWISVVGVPACSFEKAVAYCSQK